MRILLTGSSGWLGRFLAPRLRAAGHTVIGLDLAPGADTDFLGSVADRATVDRAFAYGIDAVIHAGALHKPDIARYPAQAFVDVNITGTLNLLEAANAAGHNRFVFTSTTSLMVSPTIRNETSGAAIWLDETSGPLAPRNIYGVTKLAAEGLSNACDTLSRSCARRVLCWFAFPLVPVLGSTGSATDRSVLFASFTATTTESDFSGSYIIGYGSSPFRHVDAKQLTSASKASESASRPARTRGGDGNGGTTFVRCVGLALSLVTVPLPSRSAQPDAVSRPVQPDPGTNEDMPLDIDITSKRLDVARQQIQPSLGATKYQFDQQALQAIPQGSNADMNQVVLQSPGVWQDSFGQIHIRGEMANVQYRIDGVQIPEGLSFFGQALESRLANSVSVLTGTLPAQYGIDTAGVIDIQTKTGFTSPGLAVSMYGGSWGWLEPSFEEGGHSGPVDWFISGDYLHNDRGIDNPVSTYGALHDTTNQFHGFAHVSGILDVLSMDFLSASGLRASTATVPNGIALPGYGVVNLSVVQKLKAGVGAGTELRLDVLNAGDTIYEIRNGTGVSVGAPQYGLRRTILAGVTQRF